MVSINRAGGCSEGYHQKRVGCSRVSPQNTPLSDLEGLLW